MCRVDCSHGGLRPGQPVQVLDESGLHTATQSSQYSVEEVLQWSGCRGSVVMVREEEAAVRVDFSTALMKRAIDAKTEANKLRSDLVLEREGGSKLRSALEKAEVCTSCIVDAAYAADANGSDFSQAENQLLREEIDERTQAELERLALLKRQVVTERVISKSGSEKYNLEQLARSPLRSFTSTPTPPPKGQRESRLLIFLQ